MNKERLERYSLTGPENQAAVAAGLAGGDWFRSAVPRKRMKELMRRSDYPAIRDTIIWLGLMGLFGAGAGGRPDLSGQGDGRDRVHRDRVSGGGRAGTRTTAGRT